MAASSTLNLEGRWIRLIGKSVRRHAILVAYYCIILLISIGLIHYTGYRYIGYIVLHTGALALFYFGAQWLAVKYSTRFPRAAIVELARGGQVLNLMTTLIMIFIVTFIIYHLVYLGQVPIWSSYKSLDYYGIALIRQSITDHDSKFIHYTSSILLKSIIPLFLVIIFVRKKWLFLILLPASYFYCLAMMQKGFIVSIFIPLIIYLFIGKKYILSGLFAVLAIMGVYILVLVTNPFLWVPKSKIVAEMTAQKKVYELPSREYKLTDTFIESSKAILNRVIYDPGKDVGRWFTLIPARLPYAKGCGYRFLAPLLGCDYKEYDYSHIIWDELYKREANQGLRGTVTSACFMYDYSNFGTFGLILSSFVLAVLFVMINLVFESFRTWLLVVNFLPILWLSNVSLSSTAVSGGWLLGIVFFWFYKPSLKAGGLG